MRDIRCNPKHDPISAKRKSIAGKFRLNYFVYSLFKHVTKKFVPSFQTVKMRKIQLSADDFEMFDREVGPGEYEFFKHHNGAFKRMWSEQVLAASLIDSSSTELS